MSANMADRSALEVPTNIAEEVFGSEERYMIGSVLTLADTDIKALMTPRLELAALDITAPKDAQIARLIDTPFSRLIVIENGRLDEPLGIVQKKNLLGALLSGKTLDPHAHLEQPVILLERTTAIAALEAFRRERRHMAFVVDEFGILEGIVTLTDLLEAIAGDLPDETDQGTDHSPLPVEPLDDGSFDADAGESIEELNHHLPYPLPRGRDYTTLAGLLLHQLERLPELGDSITLDGWQAYVTEQDSRRVLRVRLVRRGDNALD